MLSAAVVVAAATPGWEGGVRMMGRRCPQSERKSFAGGLSVFVFGQQSTPTAVV